MKIKFDERLIFFAALKPLLGPTEDPSDVNIYRRGFC
jgi:hypothetical protein